MMRDTIFGAVILRVFRFVVDSKPTSHFRVPAVSLQYRLGGFMVVKATAELLIQIRGIDPLVD